MAFEELPNLITKMLMNIIKNPHSYFAIIQLFENNTAKLDFIQNLEYKYIGNMFIFLNKFFANLYNK